MPVTVDGSVGERLPAPVELAAYFLVSEALTNVVKHARRRTSRCASSASADTLRVAVADDGIGGARASAVPAWPGLRDRVEALDASSSSRASRVAAQPSRAEIPCGS